jgi:hypothetical protein
LTGFFSQAQPLFWAAKSGVIFFKKYPAGSLWPCPAGKARTFHNKTPEWKPSTMSEAAVIPRQK